MPIKLAIVGVGSFAQSFIPLFKAHPLVEHVTLCDLDPAKLKANSEKWHIPDTCGSLDAVCDLDIDAAAILTQNDRHAPQAIQALETGMHVYSAVPTGINVQEITDLVRTVERTGLVYMIGETSYYYPCALYCRTRYAAGDFGHVVYGEAEYYHDYRHGMYEVAQHRFGADWKQHFGLPPMYYPTHSTSMIISVTGAHMTHVSCQGWVDVHEDGLYGSGRNIYDNPFSNQFALFKMSDGSTARINEARRIGHPGTVRLSLFGTEGSYEQNCHGPVWVTTERKDFTPLDDLLAPRGVAVKEVDTVMANVTSADGTHMHAAKIHDLARLPREFINLPNGHNGSHQFLVDDFITACEHRTTPPNNVWQAARYAIPGVIAHESCTHGGELREIPDLGDGPG